MRALLTYQRIQGRMGHGNRWIVGRTLYGQEEYRHEARIKDEAKKNFSFLGVMGYVLMNPRDQDCEDQ